MATYTAPLNAPAAAPALDLMEVEQKSATAIQDGSIKPPEKKTKVNTSSLPYIEGPGNVLIAFHDPLKEGVEGGDGDDIACITFYEDIIPGINVIITSGTDNQGRSRFDLTVEEANKSGITNINFFDQNDPRLPEIFSGCTHVGFMAPVDEPKIAEMLKARHSSYPQLRVFSQGGPNDFNRVNSCKEVRNALIELNCVVMPSLLTNKDINFSVLQENLNFPRELIDNLQWIATAKAVSPPTNTHWYGPGLFLDIIAPGSPGPFRGKMAMTLGLFGIAHKSGLFPDIDFEQHDEEPLGEFVRRVLKEFVDLYGENALCMEPVIDEWINGGGINRDVDGHLKNALTTMVIIAQKVIGIYLPHQMHLLPQIITKDGLSKPNFYTLATFPYNAENVNFTHAKSMYDMFAALAGFSGMSLEELTALMDGIPPGGDGTLPFLELLKRFE